MFSKKSILLIALVVALGASSCTRSLYPSTQSPNVTPQTTNAFTTPITGNDPMAKVQEYATGTSIALTSQAINGPTNTPGGPTPIGGTPITPVTQITFTPTPIIIGGATLTPTVTAIVVGGSTLTPAVTSSGGSPVVTNRPQTYTIQKGEFPYCIARRYDLNPQTLLDMNPTVANIPGNQIPAGTVLQIPQTGHWPDSNRALRTHPTTYTVTGNNDTTIHGVACLFGDVFPDRIVQANPGLSLTSVLTVGQKINIP